MLSKQEEQAERRETLENDRKVREQKAKTEQAGTFFSHALANATDMGGRFAQVGAQTIVGTEAARYPAPSSAHQTQLPDEAPFGVPIDTVERD